MNTPESRAQLPIGLGPLIVAPGLRPGELLHSGGFATMLAVHIVHVVPFISQRAGGPATFVAQLAPRLEALGTESTILSTNLGQVPSSGEWRMLSPDEMPPNADALDLELFEVVPPRRLARSTAMAKRLDELVPTADLVHIHSLWLHPQYAGQRAARKHEIPFVVSPHGALDPFLRKHGKPQKFLSSHLWQNGMLRAANALHVTTEEELGYVSDVAPSVPRAVIPIGIETEALATGGNAEGFRERFLDGDRSDVVLFLGRLTYKKGVDILIRSFASIAERAPTAKLVIAGPDDEGLLPMLSELASELGVGDRVVFTGPVYGEDRDDALAAAAVWALISHTENFGIAVLEALGSGLPVVVSTEVNLATTISEHDAGEVTELKPAAAGDAILKLLDDEQRRAQVSERAVQLAKTFDWAEVAPRFDAFYRETIETAKSDRSFIDAR